MKSDLVNTKIINQTKEQKNLFERETQEVKTKIIADAQKTLAGVASEDAKGATEKDIAIKPLLESAKSLIGYTQKNKKFLDDYNFFEPSEMPNNFLENKNLTTDARMLAWKMTEIVNKRYNVISKKTEQKISKDTFIKLAEKFKIELDKFLERITYLTIVDSNTGEVYVLDEKAEVELLKGTLIDEKRKKIPSIAAIKKYLSKNTRNKNEERVSSLFEKFNIDLAQDHIKKIQQAYQNTKERFLQKGTKIISYSDGTTEEEKWENKGDSNWIVWKYYSGQHCYKQYRAIKNLGVIAEGYVAALLDTNQPYLRYKGKNQEIKTVKLNWENANPEECIGMLYHTYISQVDSLTGILQEDVHFKDSNNNDIFLGVKTAGTASTGSYASIVALAEAIVIAYNKGEGLGEQNLQKALKEIIEKISNRELSIGKVFQNKLLQIDEFTQI